MFEFMKKKDERLDPAALNYKIRFEKEHLVMCEFGEMLNAPGGFVVVDESDWWLEFYFDKFLNSIRSFFKYFIVGNRHKNVARQKKDDDYRPIETMDGELSQIIRWDYRDCTLHLNRRTLRRPKRSNPKEFRKKERESFAPRALENFERLQNPKFKDLAIVVGNFVFLVDSHVVQTQSPWFRMKLLEMSMSPQEAFPTIEFKKLTPQDMEALLVYMYCHTWPTHVHTNAAKRPCPSNRFFKVLKAYGVILSTDNEESTRLKRTEKICEPEAFLVGAFLPGLYSQGWKDKSIALSKEPREMERRSWEDKLSTEKSKFKIQKSNWDFPGEGFKYKNSKTDEKIQNPDLKAKKEIADRMVEDFEIVAEAFEFAQPKISTIEWVNKNN